MKKTPLAKLADNALRAIECPEDGFVFDDFDKYYTAKERNRDERSAKRFYEKNISFESVYETDDADDKKVEPAWVSDTGRGKDELESQVSYEVDGDELAEDGRITVDRELRWHSAYMRVCRRAPHCITTFNLIRKYGKNRKESIWALARKMKKA